MNRILALLSLTLLAACADAGGGHDDRERASAAPAAPSNAPRCAEPDEGCACDGNQPPVSCQPSVEELGAANAEGLCFEGTRRCIGGVFGGCEGVHAFAAPSPSAAALVDRLARHPQCSDCDPRCFTVGDELSPDDGPLDSSFADGVVFHASGAGISLEQGNPAPPPPPILGLPPGSLLTDVLVGRSATVMHAHQYVVGPTDVYVLSDMALTMAEETQWLIDRWTGGASYLDGSIRCADGDQTWIDQGVNGAARCMFEDVRFGTGTFGDIPFEPYATDEALGVMQRSMNAQDQITFEHLERMTDNTSILRGLISFESTGSPDTASAQIPALYSVATGEGMYTGIGRRSVPAPSACPSDTVGYPCFRQDVQRVVVMLTDSPMHNGPDAARFAYDYAPENLEMLVGTGPGVITIPSTNETFDLAYSVSDDASSGVAVFTGSTRGMTADVEAAIVGCGAHDLAADAVFAFDVESESGAVDVRLSADGTAFPAVLAVFEGAPKDSELLPSAGDGNELFASAYDLGDVTERYLRIPGDTSNGMSADYQGSLIGAACGANTLAPDAVYAFDVSSAGGPLDVEVSADMGGSRAVVAIYDDTGARRWPASDSPLVAVGNSGRLPADVFAIPSGAGNEYVSVIGNTTTLGADYNPADLGDTQCNPEATAKDAAFRIHVDGTRTLRFDTEGSSFDTVLSLHARPPLTNAGASRRYTAGETHDNANEDAATSWGIDEVNGRTQVFEGDTAGMSADIIDTLGCGTQADCGDAVYRIHVSERTALRLAVDGTGYEPGVLITRADPAGVSGQYLPIAAGGRHTCAISAGDVFCWGADDQGQLGNGGALGAGDSSAAVGVSGITGDVQSICAGSAHACAVTVDGRVHCWGAGAQGRLGNGASTDQVAPVIATDIGEGQTLGPAAQVTCGDAFSCALLRDGRVACFGANAANQIGDGTTADRSTPTLVTTTERFEQIDAGSRHTCAIRTSDDAVFCWGEGTHGKLGDGAVTANPTPARAGSLIAATYVMAGGNHTCASLSSGRVYCWGRNNVGQLGGGSTDTSVHSSPVVVRNADGSADLANVFGGVGAGEDHTCVTTLEGFTMCWGGNANLEIGHNNAAVNVTRPIGAFNVLDAVQVASGYDHTCAVRANGALLCWGSNADAQVGDGTSTMAAIPTRSQASASTGGVSFGDGTVDAAFSEACQSIGRPPEQGCELRAFSDKSYFFCDGAQHGRTWAGAAQACEAIGMQLSDVDEPGENAFIASQLESGEQAWLGVKRETDDNWLNLSDGAHFENLNGERIWYTQGTSWLTGDVRGYFTDAAASDLVDSNPRWTSSSTWAGSREPSGGDGENCVTIDRNGDWRTERCSAVPPRANCGLFGLGCLFGFLGDLLGGVLDWIVPWGGDLVRLIFDSLGGRYAAPLISGGVDHAYVCEQRDSAGGIPVAGSSDITLDSGDYYVTVKGIDDGIAGNACEGPYELTLTDLGAPRGGFITCDDNSVAETETSVIERTLTTGDYFLILKGKHAADEGDYKLTVRDVAAVPGPAIACDAGLGVGDPATATITAEPGRQYYAVVKGDGPLDSGSFELAVRDASVSAAALACDSESSAMGDPELMLSLPAGSYYAVLKGSVTGGAGDYNLVVGAGEPDTATFEPPTYDATVEALNDQDIRVATVLACDPSVASCADAREQALLLAEDTGGAVVMVETAQDTPQQVVQVLRQVTAADSIAGALVFAPDLNPGFTPYGVEAIPDPGNGCTMGADGQSFVDCAAGATPAFLVTLHNPVLAPVAAPLSALGVYQFTLRVTTERDRDTTIDDIPIYVRPTGAPEPGAFTSGEYFQDMEATGCQLLNEEARRLTMLDPVRYPGVADLRPSWDELRFDADVMPDTSVTFLACGANSEDELRDCDEEDRKKRVVTITAGSGAGMRCSVATQAMDCAGGYCSPYTGVCNFLEGKSCETDADCPSGATGSCHDGPSSVTIGSTCLVEDLIADPGIALGSDNLQFVRMILELESGDAGTRTPSVFNWQARYHCKMAE